MALETAPFHADVADGPEGGQAWWLTCEDGTRIRVGAWPAGPSISGGLSDRQEGLSRGAGGGP